MATRSECNAENAKYNRAKISQVVIKALLVAVNKIIGLHDALYLASVYLRIRKDCCLPKSLFLPKKRRVLLFRCGKHSGCNRFRNCQKREKILSHLRCKNKLRKIHIKLRQYRNSLVAEYAVKSDSMYLTLR